MRKTKRFLWNSLLVLGMICLVLLASGSARADSPYSIEGTSGSKVFYVEKLRVHIVVLSRFCSKFCTSFFVVFCAVMLFYRRKVKRNLKNSRCFRR